MNLIKNLNIKLKSIQINKIMKNYKYVHLMFNDKFNKPFVDFLNRNFDTKEHLVLYKQWFKEYPAPAGTNVIKIEKLKDLKFDYVEKIICHSLFDQELIDYLYKHQNILTNKAYWLIWGGDLYNAPRDTKNDFVRSNLKGYIGDVDNKILLERYNNKKTPKNAWYTFPITLEMMNNTTTHNKEDKKIQINNSCDYSTIEILDILSKFKDKNIKITTILSYGQMQYKEEIITKGKEIFKDKFEYIENYMQPKDYVQYIANNDILILNQNRQQGFGNTIVALYLGKKVFIKNTNSSYQYFLNNGIKIYETNDINKIDFEELFTDEYKEKNKKAVTKFFDEKELAEAWKEVFNE